MSLDPKKAKQILEGFRDHADFCRESLSIRNEQGQQVPLELRPAQLKQQLSIRRQEQSGKPVRQIALKARRVTWSVGACTQIFKRIAFMPGQRACCFAQDDDTTRTLYDYFKQFVQSYKPYHGLKMLPVMKCLDSELYIEWQGDSSVEFQTAKTYSAKRGKSFRHVLFDEMAFFPAAANKLMLGVLQTVPHDPFTSIYKVSTANGVGGAFYDDWMSATDPSKESDWVAEFFAWHEEPRNAMPLTKLAEVFQKTLTPREVELRRMHRLSLEQLQWRRWKIANDCQGSEDGFDQEFPSSAEVAFLVSGRPRFDLRSIERCTVTSEPQAGALEIDRVGLRDQIVFVSREDGFGSLRVWKRPERHRRYCAGSDPSRGQDIGLTMGKSDPDYSVLQMLDVETHEQVAVLRARLAPHAFAEYTIAVCRWYNDAFLVPEANELGYIDALNALGFPVSRLYLRGREADDLRPLANEEIGFMTTETTKLQLVSKLDRSLRERGLTIHCAITAQELRTFVYLPNGKMGGQPGCHDDCVISLALAELGIAAMPPPRPQQESGQLGPVRYGTGNSNDQGPIRRGINRPLR